jgi:uncharacterized membrane protein
MPVFITGGKTGGNMANHPVDIVVAGFDDELSSEKVLEDIKAAGKDGRIKLYDAALIIKDVSGKLSIKETNDAGAIKGAAVGGAAGALVGLILGPLALPLLGGAAIGAIAAKLSDAGLPDDWLKRMGETIQAGSAVIVAEVDPESSAAMDLLLKEAKANVVSRGISEDSIVNIATALNSPPAA